MTESGKQNSSGAFLVSLAIVLTFLLPFSLLFLEVVVNIFVGMGVQSGIITGETGYYLLKYSQMPVSWMMKQRMTKMIIGPLVEAIVTLREAARK